MAVDFKNEILKILDEIKNNREKIEQYEIFGSIFNNVEKEQYSRLIDSSYSIKIDGIVNLQEDVNVKELLIKLRTKLDEIRNICDLVTKRDNLKFSMTKNIIDKRVSKLEEIKKDYILFDEDEEKLDFSLKINKRLLEFIGFKNKLEKRLFEKNKNKIDIEEYEKYFNELHEFNDLKSEMSGLWGEPRNIISGIDIEIQKLIFRMNVKMSSEALKVTEEKIQNLESQSLRNLTGFFFVFTLIASNITLIFKASESLNIFYFIALIFVINSVVIFAVMTIFRTITSESKKYDKTLWFAAIGMLLGIVILILGAIFPGYGIISEKILDKRIEVKSEEINSEIIELKKDIKKLEVENEELKKTINVENKK